jgi:hypothetical protein
MAGIILFVLNNSGVGEFFHPTFDNSGMNYQQRNRALFRNVASARDADLTPNPLF